MDVTWRFLKNVQHTYDREQKLVEKYDVSSTGTGGGGGEYRYRMDSAGATA
ncbi:trehalase [Enterobacter cloacae]|uniref:Trehalase n=1 Tax=Enterobacter cloacae TaxID=550 RepID=A0A377LZW0_ENTCL|nr:trehalase [Enterobacter cloacae]